GAARCSTASSPTRSAGSTSRRSIPTRGTETSPSSGPNVHPRYRSVSSPTTSCPAPRSTGTSTAPMYPRCPVTTILTGRSRPAGPRGASPAEDGLPGVEGFRVAARRVRLHPPQAHEAEERVLGEPPLLPLRPVRPDERLHLPASHLFGEVQECPGRAEVPVVLRDLELEDQVVPEGVPGQLAHEAVVLVQVVPLVGQHDVGAAVLQRLEELLHLPAGVGEEAVAEAPELHPAVAHPLQERVGAGRRLVPALPGGAADHP